MKECQVLSQNRNMMTRPSFTPMVTANMMTRPSVNRELMVTGNLNNILETNKEPEDEDSKSGLKSLCQKLDKDEEIEEKINKDPADIASKV